MSKTPAELAINYCEPLLSDDYAKTIGRKDWIGTRCVKVGEGHELYKAFLAGYEAGRKITDQEIVDIIVDIREREAKEQSSMPPLQQERHNHIWEKIKVKLVGIF